MKRLLLIFFICISTLLSAHALGKPEADPIVRLYPNPASSFVNIDLGRVLNKGYSIQVYSFLGRKMYDVANVSQRLTLSLTDYNRGVYIYQLRDRSGKLVETGKFQVSK